MVNDHMVIEDGNFLGYHPLFSPTLNEYNHGNG